MKTSQPSKVTQSIKRILEVPFIHPFIFATFPFLTVFANVFDQVELSKIYRPLLVLYTFVLILLILLNLIFRDEYRAAFSASTIIIMFFYLNYIELLPKTIEILGIGMSRNWVYLAAWIIVLLLLNSKLFWGRIRPKILTQFLNITALFLLTLPAVRLSRVIMDYYQDPLRSWEVPLANEIAFPAQTQANYPDIYYIILDGYARADTLSELYSYDNHEFLDFLAENDFYVADMSQSNYTQTALSLASSLNFSYLSFLGEFGDESSNRDPLKMLIEKNRVQDYLKNHGYQTLAFSSGYYLTENTTADLYLTPFDWQFSNLEGLLYNRSAARVITELVGLDPDFDDFDTHYKRVLYTLDELGNLASLTSDRPIFVFAHIIAPHPPFVFDQDGNLIEEDRLFTFEDFSIVYGSPEEYIKKYKQQLAFINTGVMNLVTQILSDSASDPIIILQADHGPAAYFNPLSTQNRCISERFSIFNAYHLPNGKTDTLYDSITPVNTFRVIFDQYFDSDFGLLEDKTYFSNWMTPYKFVEMSDISQSPCVIEVGE